MIGYSRLDAWPEDDEYPEMPEELRDYLIAKGELRDYDYNDE